MSGIEEAGRQPRESVIRPLPLRCADESDSHLRLTLVSLRRHRLRPAIEDRDRPQGQGSRFENRGEASEHGRPVVSDSRQAVSSSLGLEGRAIAAAKAGEWDAIHYLYARYADDVFADVQSVVDDRAAAEEITHDVFMKLSKAIDEYEEHAAPFAAWIMEVARNAALDHVQAPG